jgi:hypothetical protein
MTDPSPPVAPPGWYPDPHKIHRRRYWDGSTWTKRVIARRADEVIGCRRTVLNLASVVLAVEGDGPGSAPSPRSLLLVIVGGALAAAWLPRGLGYWLRLGALLLGLAAVIVFWGFVVRLGLWR